MRQFVGLLVVAVLVAAGMAAGPIAARGADVDVMVNGGGTADFVATPNSVNTSGYTQFSVSATVYSDGAAAGHFVCQIPAVVIISGDVLGGWVNDDGSVTVVGLAHGYDHFFQIAFTELPFTATLRAGGPGVGGFDYRDESGFFGAGQFDTELVRRGMIQIGD
jgi:hypothetical protein